MLMMDAKITAINGYTEFNFFVIFFIQYGCITCIILFYIKCIASGCLKYI